MLDLYTGRIPYLDGDPTGANALQSDAGGWRDAVQMNDQMIANTEAMFQSVLKEATASPAHGAGADIPADGMPAGLPPARPGVADGSMASDFMAGIDRGGVERAETPRPPNAPRPGRRVASGRRDDPIFVYEVSTRVAH